MPNDGNIFKKKAVTYLTENLANIQSAARLNKTQAPLPWQGFPPFFGALFLPKFKIESVCSDFSAVKLLPSYPWAPAHYQSSENLLR
mmetsp:Transcript_5997/g.9647  ORF Transcript_5997/g.9647 Transcript_5997/m.9647 type:complete len:87 (+) Transcript_5997:1544-1804(+)